MEDEEREVADRGINRELPGYLMPRPEHNHRGALLARFDHIKLACKNDMAEVIVLLAI